MSDVKLADLYQGANIAISVEDFKLRQASFTSLDKSLSEKQVTDLCRMYYGWWEKEAEFNWFLDAFTPDPRFSFNANRRESSVLAGGLLLSSLKRGNAFAGLTVLTSSVLGRREPCVPGIKFEVFDIEFKNLTVKKTESRWYNTTFKALGKTTVTQEKMLGDGAVGTVVAQVQAAMVESHAATQTALSETQSLITKLAKDLETARAELEMLWWLTGGWSRQLNTPFAELGSSLASIAAGFDLADLSITVHGPYSAKALLSRVIASVKKSRKNNAISDIGDAPTDQQLPLLGLSEDAHKYPDICPVSGALAMSSSIGRGAPWHQAYERNAHISPTIEISALDLAVQCMYERLLLGNL